VQEAGRAVRELAQRNRLHPEPGILLKSQDEGARELRLRTLYLCSRPRALRTNGTHRPGPCFVRNLFFNPIPRKVFWPPPRGFHFKSDYGLAGFQEKFPPHLGLVALRAVANASIPIRVFYIDSFLRTVRGGRISYGKRSRFVACAGTKHYTVFRDSFGPSPDWSAIGQLEFSAMRWLVSFPLSVELPPCDS